MGIVGGRDVYGWEVGREMGVEGSKEGARVVGREMAR